MASLLLSSSPAAPALTGRAPRRGPVGGVRCAVQINAQSSKTSGLSGLIGLAGVVRSGHRACLGASFAMTRGRDGRRPSASSLAAAADPDQDGAADPDVETAPASAAEVAQMKAVAIKAELKKFGVSTSGVKAQLEERLVECIRLKVRFKAPPACVSRPTRPPRGGRVRRTRRPRKKTWRVW